MGSGDLEFHLTSRQVEVLDLLARGRTNPQIAEALGISLPGAKWHVSEVMNKLGAASREEAVAAWREHQRLTARGSRFLRGLLPIVALKSVLLAGGAMATGSAAVVAVVALRPSGAAPETLEPPAAVAQATPAVPHDVERRARELIAEVMAPYPVWVLPPGTRAATPVPGSRFPGHRPVGADDYVALEAQFTAGATSVETNVSGEHRVLSRPRDVWVVRLGLQPPWERGQQAEPTHLVAFDAASGELIAGGVLGPLPPGGDSGLPGDGILARFDAGPVTFWLLASALLAMPSPSDDPSAGAARQAAPLCLGEVDSRMPRGLGGACMERAVDPAANPLEASVHNSQGFAHTWGLVAANVASIRAITEDGREVVVAPGTVEVDARGSRGFIAVAPGPEWFVLVEALDAAGNVVDTLDTSNHPANPPLPGTGP